MDTPPTFSPDPLPSTPARPLTPETDALFEALRTAPPEPTHEQMIAAARELYAAKKAGWVFAAMTDEKLAENYHKMKLILRLWDRFYEEVALDRAIEKLIEEAEISAELKAKRLAEARERRRKNDLVMAKPKNEVATLMKSLARTMSFALLLVQITDILTDSMKPRR